MWWGYVVADILGGSYFLGIIHGWLTHSHYIKIVLEG